MVSAAHPESPGFRRGLGFNHYVTSSGHSTHDKKPRVETRGHRVHAATQVPSRFNRRHVHAMHRLRKPVSGASRQALGCSKRSGNGFKSISSAKPAATISRPVT